MLRRVGFALVVLVVALAGIEVVARVAEPRLVPERTLPTPKPGAQPAFVEAAARARDRLKGVPMIRDDATKWALPPDRIVMSGDVPCRINALGLRGPELAAKVDGEVRLLTVGDSTVFGDGVPEAQVFSSVAAVALAKTWGRPVVPVIGGVPGHDSGQSLARLRQKGAAIAPDWVVIGNLWSDVYKDQGFVRDADVDVIRGPLTHLAAYRVARALLEPWLLPRRVRWLTTMDGAGGDRSRVLLHTYVANLRALAEEALRLGARPAFLALPAPVDLDPAGPPDAVAAYREAMAQVARDVGAPFVDAPAAFREAGATIGYFADQVHPNAVGHELLGVTVARGLGNQ